MAKTFSIFYMNILKQKHSHTQPTLKMAAIDLVLKIFDPSAFSSAKTKDAKNAALITFREIAGKYGAKIATTRLKPHIANDIFA